MSGITYTTGTIVSFPQNDWVLNRNQIITAALRKLRVLEPGATPSADQITYGAEALNAMVKEWDNDGIKLWLQEWKTKDLALADNFNFALDTLSVDKAMLRDASGADTSVAVVGMQTYLSEPDKASTGPPRILAIQPGVPLKGYLWPVPDLTTYVLHYLQTRRLKDFDVSTDTPDLPVRWELALIYGLAAHLSLEHRIPNVSDESTQRLQASLFALADKYRQRALLGGHQTDNDCFVTPAYREKK